jgi:hypothetical protein
MITLSELRHRSVLRWSISASLILLSMLSIACGGSSSGDLQSGQSVTSDQALGSSTTGTGGVVSRLSKDQLFLLDPPPEGVVLVHDSYWGGTQADGSWYSQMYAPPTARDLVSVVVTLRLTAISGENPTEGIGNEEGTAVEPTGNTINGAPVYQTRTEDGWLSITWRDPVGLRFFLASRDLDEPDLLKLAETIRAANKAEVQKAIVPFDPTRPRSEQISGVVSDAPPPTLVPEESGR